MDFSKFDKNFNLEELRRDIEELEKTEGTGEFREVPHDTYIVKIEKIELTESKKHDPMFSCWMRIVEGEYEGSMIFMNQVVTRDFQISIVKRFLRTLGTEVEVDFESYTQFGNMIMDIAEAIDGKLEYKVEYGERKGFNTFEIKEVFDVE